MNTLETSLFKMGYVRCPNDSSRWYPSGPGIPEVKDADVHLSYDLQHYPEGRIILRPKPWTLGKQSWCTVLPDAIGKFDNVEDFKAWLTEHGTPSEPGQCLSFWD